MENQKNDNLNLLEAVVQNTEMGKNTLEQILPMTSDVQFKAELLRQRLQVAVAALFAGGAVAVVRGKQQLQNDAAVL